MRERVLTTLDHCEPDTVPLTELSIDPPHMETLAGRKLERDSSTAIQVAASRRKEMVRIEMIFRCYKKLGFELIPCDVSTPDEWEATKNADGSITDEWGRILRFDAQASTWSPFPSQGIFHTPEDFEKFASPDPESPGRLFELEHMRKLADDNFAVAVLLREPFTSAYEILTMNRFVQWLYEKPALIKKTIDRLTDLMLPS